MEEIPRCKHCGRLMQYNPGPSTQTVKQYLCGCRGVVYHKNVTQIGTLELKKDVKTWRR